jgi:hypothetical protein
MNRQDRLRAQREGGKVTRAHTAGGYHGHYDIAQHSFNMLLLLYELHPNPSVNLIKAISYHDLAERYTGDLPAPALLEFPEVRSSLKKIESVVAESMGLNVEITAEDKAWVASLDKVEHWLWCHDQLSLGNTLVKAHIHLLGQIFEDLKQRGMMPPPVQTFINTFEFKRGTDGLPS